MKKSVVSQDYSLPASGLWSAESHEKLLDWQYEGTLRNVRVQHVRAASGDTEYESGPALIGSLNNAVTKDDGTTTADIDIQFSGSPTRTPKP